MSESPDLATLLRTWRARLQPEAVGLQAAHSSRTPGLRRDDLAKLAGVSSGYLKRLEQGRAHPSGGVLRALARALLLSDTEYELACRLAGHAADPGRQIPQTVGPSVQRMMERFSDVPMAVFDASWTLLECNQPYRELIGDTYGAGCRSANLTWQYFRDEPCRVRHTDPDEFERWSVADLRDVASRYPADRELADMIDALQKSSPKFARLWQQGSVAHHGSDHKTVDHPELGPLELDCDVLSLHGLDLRVVVFTAERGSDVADKLRLLNLIDGEQAASPSSTDRIETPVSG